MVDSGRREGRDGTISDADHVEMHGQIAHLDAPFSNGLFFPGIKWRCRRMDKLQMHYCNIYYAVWIYGSAWCKLFP